VAALADTFPGPCVSGCGRRLDGCRVQHEGLVGIGSPTPKPGALLVDVVCVGRGTVQIDLRDSQVQQLTDPRSLSCRPDVSSTDAQSIGVVLNGGEIMIHTMASSDTDAVLVYEISVQST
jgi:hypothetical protein